MKPLTDGIIKSSIRLKPRLAGFGTRPSLLSQKKTGSASFGQLFCQHIYIAVNKEHMDTLFKLSQKRRPCTTILIGLPKKVLTSFHGVLLDPKLFNTVQITS